MSFPLRLKHQVGLISALIVLVAVSVLVIASASVSSAQDLSLRDLVNPSTVDMKDGKTVTFALYGFIEFNSLSEAFRYIDSQSNRWPTDKGMSAEGRHARALELLRHAVESRVVSMTDERPLEVLLTRTDDEVKEALAQVKEPVPPGYADAFLAVRKKWKHSLNCWSASPVMAARVLSNWYPIEEGINLYGATYDSTEHFWQAVKYHPDVTVGQLYELLQIFQKTDWTKWLGDLENDPSVYLPNAYAIEFLRHNLAPERLQWFRDELARQGLPADGHPRQLQQRSAHSPHFAAYEEKVLWGDLADLFHLIYHFSTPQAAVKDELARRHFDGIYLGDRKLGFISEEFRAQMLEIWKVKYLQMPRFREVISSIPREVELSHFLNDGDSPDIPISIYVGYLNQIREMAKKPDPVEAQPKSSGTTSAPAQKKSHPTGP
jgi:hypothetical protein